MGPKKARVIKSRSTKAGVTKAGAKKAGATKAGAMKAGATKAGATKATAARRTKQKAKVADKPADNHSIRGRPGIESSEEEVIAGPSGADNNAHVAGNINMFDAELLGVREFDHEESLLGSTGSGIGQLGMLDPPRVVSPSDAVSSHVSITLKEKNLERGICRFLFTPTTGCPPFGVQSALSHDFRR
jgi:hypothetical protein